MILEPLLLSLAMIFPFLCRASFLKLRQEAFIYFGLLLLRAKCREKFIGAAGFLPAFVLHLA